MIRGFGSSEVRIGVRTMRCQPSLRDLEVVGVLFPSLEGPVAQIEADFGRV